MYNISSVRKWFGKYVQESEKGIKLFRKLDWNWIVASSCCAAMGITVKTKIKGIAGIRVIDKFRFVTVSISNFMA
jgi:hypothetical protein